MWDLDYKESWIPNNWWFRTVVLEKTLKSPLEFKEIEPINPQENQSWIFIGRTDAETETPVVWPPDAKSWLIWQDPDAGKDWRQEEKGRQRMGWLNGITNSLDMSLSKRGVDDGQGGLANGHKRSDKTEWLNWTELTLSTLSEFFKHLAVHNVNFKKKYNLRAQS